VKGIGRKLLKFLIQALWDVALFQLAKGDFFQGNISYIFRSAQRRNNGFLFLKNGNLT
jgi:hypothetical protein